ncbi:tRNA (adenosine(37)-N6)-threonylcarbamoyltransferase complex dimerization subunit type 1 TsaB [Nakamurella sp. YIM 132087]|uniref:tRNA (Adenosine(37)-N6)-threonylcarbamoyltransferase complex dimerization subunit type 1 TsaB n=1 Tax=Nakamurella alba TaxID=2665158 RepID=A0A7K1FNI0_9ACTN|nr:tRNA (adenosine(37)-N6)-threonylcarbamoyltransferase complex dimerization subunit type 1 TsaB [Nakamurella alba]MTD14344.1 tRNA (adenosine(37)-N6)-threonylcarbamoyltransferase complex dimerization subunit type 1 TsaB [Nakamurella alba]
MLILALDTSTPAVTAAVATVRRPHEVEIGPDGPGPLHELLAERLETDGRRHVEQLIPLAKQTLGDAGFGLRDVDAVVVGLGPGPFTGLRVGIATAAALGDALEIPVHGVPSHDAVAGAHAPAAGEFLVVTDARRREVYASAYRPDGRRIVGPEVLPATGLAQWLTAAAAAPVQVIGAGAELAAEHFGLPVVPVHREIGWGLVERAMRALLTGAVPGPLTPLYLRKPDAVEPTTRKSVLGPAAPGQR